MLAEIFLITALGTSPAVASDPLDSALDYIKQVDHTVLTMERQEAKEQAALEAEEERLEAAAVTSRSYSRESVWDDLAACESGGRWGLNDEYDGGLQFAPSTWTSMAPASYPDYAYLASREQQIAVAEDTLAVSSYAQQWPTCSAQLGLS